MPPPDSKRQTFLELIQQRLEGIHVAEGYATDAGDTVTLNEAPRFGENDPDIAIAILIGEDTPQRQGHAVLQVLPVEIQALARADLNEPWVVSEQVLADIQRAIEVEDELMRGNAKRAIEIGQTRTIPREAGTTAVGVAITYLLHYGRAWGQP